MAIEAEFCHTGQVVQAHFHAPCLPIGKPIAGQGHCFDRDCVPPGIMPGARGGYDRDAEMTKTASSPKQNVWVALRKNRDTPDRGGRSLGGVRNPESSGFSPLEGVPLRKEP